MKNTTQNVKKVMIIYLLVIVSLISYILYFMLFTADKIVDRADNKILLAKNNSVLRGTIYDKNMMELSTSTKESETSQTREYKGGEATAQVLGYADSVYGVSGLESTYNKYLVNDPSESLVSYFKNGFKTVDKVGESLVTTLDYNVQQSAFNALGDNKGSIVILNVKTGEIIAMVSKPSYDPNNLKDQWEGINSNENLPLLNRAVAGMYPPGSTFKIITAASAIENMPEVTSRTFQDKGYITIGKDYKLNNDNSKAMGNIDLKTAFAKSSNVVFGTLGMELEDKLKDTAEKFMFNKDVSADGVVINNSRFPEYNSSEPGNQAQSALGQAEVLATPMQMALVAQTIANDGVMMEPHLVSKIIDNKGETTQTIEAKEINRVISSSAASLVREYMRAVIETGTGSNANVPGVNVAGKTGTAESGDGKESHAWFVGFAPYENPEIAVAVIAENGGYGGQVAAKAAAEVMTTYFAK